MGEYNALALSDSSARCVDDAPVIMRAWWIEVLHGEADAVFPARPGVQQ